ncbi:MAG: PKD domain-containing protein [Bacteroidales bacterium]
MLKQHKRFFIFLGLYFFVTTTLFAAFVPVETAEQVARNFYYHHYNAEETGNVLMNPEQVEFERPAVIEQQGEALIYVFNRKGNQGYVLVSADDLAFPVLNYAFKGHYNPNDENMPDGLEYFIEGYKAQIAYAIDHSIEPFPHTEEAWSSYFYGVMQSQIKSQSPLTDSIAWDQGCYFNAMCPSDNNAGSGLCNHVPVGCVATAMGIVMKYNGYPSHGNGTETFNSNYGQLSVDFGNAIYHWDNMPNQLTGHNAEVAKISYHAGVAVNMNYTANGSGAIFGHYSHTPTAETALQNHFGYPDAEWDVKSQNTFAAWENRLRGNLDSLSPVLYAGGVHAFVCDGYQGSSNNHFHFNWGWGGMYNSYCYLNNIVPGGTGTGGGTGNYTNDQQAVFDVIPPQTTPVADFTANMTTLSPGGKVFFTDFSDYVPTDWYWDFGDGDTSNQQYPVHTYTAAGTYNVKLIVSNNHGSDSLVKSSYITVQPSSSINANIYASQDTAYVSDQISFTNASGGNPTSTTWDFGDNTYATTSGATHIYSTAGVYTVHLTASNNSGSDTASKNIVILPAPIPSADFEADTVAVAAGTNAKFYDLSTNQPYNWNWDFGDGYSSSSQNPTHQYQSAGDYSVKLVATNSYGTDSIVKIDYIQIYQAAPVADFSVSNTSVVDGQTIQFIDQSNGIVDTYAWDFGDGNTASTMYPSHSYTDPGVYTVTLTVSNSAGSSTETKTDLITVGSTGVENNEEMSFKVYPNPVTDLLYVELDNPQHIRQLKLVDIAGKTIQQHNNPNQTTSFNTSRLSQGLYLMEIVGENHIVRQKIMVR